MNTPLTKSRKCQYCFEPFETEYETKVYCQRRCKENAKRRRKGVREFGIDWPIKFERVCPTCGNTYTTSRSVQVYCDNSCSDYAKTQRKRERVDLLDRQTRQKFRNKVYLRDEGICKLCNQLVHLSIKYPDPKSPSLDHIIPLSKGGTHALKNLQLTHLECNIKKGNKTFTSLEW